MTTQTQAKHVHNPAAACSCTVEHRGSAIRIIYCPVHAAAPNLLEACKLLLPYAAELLEVSRSMDGVLPSKLNAENDIERAEAAIAKAEGAR
jgi:hypothetical protein